MTMFDPSLRRSLEQFHCPVRTRLVAFDQECVCVTGILLAFGRVRRVGQFLDAFGLELLPELGGLLVSKIREVRVGVVVKCR